MKYILVVCLVSAVVAWILIRGGSQKKMPLVSNPQRAQMYQFNKGNGIRIHNGFQGNESIHMTYHTEYPANDREKAKTKKQLG